MNSTLENTKLSPTEVATLTERVTETYKSLITLSIEGFRYLALVNGGAVVALLAYLGKDGDTVNPVKFEHAFYGFAFGLIACALSMFFAYKTQLKLFNALVEHGRFLDTHKCEMKAGLICYGLSIGGFVYGAYSAISAFQA